MVGKIRGDGTSSRSAAGEIHPALPKLRDQLQSRGRHGAPLHRETKRHRSRETLERIWQAPRVAAIAQRIARKVTHGKRQLMNVDRLVPQPMARPNRNALGTARSTFFARSPDSSFTRASSRWSRRSRLQVKVRRTFGMR